MIPGKRDFRTLALAPLMVYLVAAGVGSLFFNPISQQYQFAALMASEFATFSLAIYIYMHKDFGRLAIVWYVVWWLFVGVLLSLALY